MKRAIIFDLDGTLLDTIDSMEAAGTKMLQEMGLPRQPRDRYRQFAGDGAKMLVTRALEAGGVTDPAEVERAFSVYMGYFARTCTYHVVPYPGISELLRALKQKGLRLAVLSNKPDQQTRDVVERCFGDAAFDLVFGQRDGMPKKPAPDGAIQIARKFSVSPEECLYVGDTNVDMQTGLAAGMQTVGVLWGFRDRKELEENHAWRIIADPAELLQLL